MPDRKEIVLGRKTMEEWRETIGRLLVKASRGVADHRPGASHKGAAALPSPTAGSLGDAQDNSLHK